MTSVTSRWEVEDVIWLATKDRMKVQQIMRSVDAYASGIRRMYETRRLMEPFGYLAAGESDLGMEVTKCKECEIPKKFAQYYVDRNSPTGYRNICKRCEPRPLNLNPDLMITCSSCKIPQTAGDNFFRRRDTSSGYGQKCKTCSGSLRCSQCGKWRKGTMVTDVCVFCKRKEIGP